MSDMRGNEGDLQPVIAKLQEIADQYPADEFNEGGDAVLRCAGYGIPIDGIQATAIRERMLAEIRTLRGGQHG